jgi:hypothetical protein
MNELLAWFQAQNASARTYGTLASRALNMVEAGHADAAAFRLIGDQAMRFFLKYEDEPLFVEEGTHAFEVMTNILHLVAKLHDGTDAEQIAILNQIAKADLIMRNK